MVFYPVNTFLNRKAKSGVGKVVETELELHSLLRGLVLYSSRHFRQIPVFQFEFEFKK